MADPKIGIIGLGNMGAGIAESYRRAGIPIAVWDIAAARRAPFEGRRGVTVTEPGDMAGICGLLLFAVPASPQIEDCLKGRDGVLAGARKGLVIYDLTTSDPAHTKRLARRAARRAVAYLDAGMTGGAQRAADGTLTLMIGGDKKVFARTRRRLAPMADALFHVGPSGAGHTLKLIHNMVCHAIFLVTAEGGRMAEKAGIPLTDMIDVFNAGNARSFISERRFPDHILSGAWNAGSRIGNLHKDLGMAMALGRALGVDAGVGKETLSFLERAARRGMADDDFSLLYRDFDEIKGGRKKPAKRLKKS